MNLTQIVAVANTVGSLLPVAASLVQAVESAMPAGTPGSTKLEAVRVGLSSIYSTGSAVAVEFEAVWGPLQAMIATLVTAFNAVGLFARKGQNLASLPAV